MENPNTNALRNEETSANDPIEAIYALNIGDFVAESFFSDELLHKISHRLSDDPSKLKAQLEELIHIYSMDNTLGILGLDAQAGFLLYDSIAATLARMFQLDTCHLFQLSSKETGEQTLSLTGTSLELDRSQRWEISLSTKASDFLNDALRAPKTLLITDTSQLTHWHPLERLRQNQTRSLIATPLKEGSRSMGVLLLESHQPTSFSTELEILAQATAQVFVTGMRLQNLVAEAQEKINNAHSNPNALCSMRAQITESIADLGIHQQHFVEALSSAIDARHNFTHGHSKQVGELARAMAEQLNLNEKTIDLVYLAGLLGSLGKIHIPTELINKKESLSPEEWDKLRSHPNVGVNLLVQINFLSEVVPYVQSQNERWDGSGKPDGLAGRSIPLGSRILAVANAYYAMTQERPYRGEPLNHAQALAVLQKEAGSKWDPLIVEALSAIPPDQWA